MRKIFCIILILVNFGLFGQTKRMVLNSIDKTLSGSCGSPDGNESGIAFVPSSYTDLSTNGYCSYSYPTTGVVTACFSMIATSSAIDFNAGFSTFCNTVTFFSSNLYTSGCISLGAGLNFTGLSSGTTYIWCITMRANGGGGCGGFTTFCPYFMDASVLPIQLISFYGNSIGNANIIKWSTATEINNHYFKLEKSQDGVNFITLSIIEGAGNSTLTNYYAASDINPYDISYYRLTQVDYNGNEESFNIIVIEKKTINLKLIKIINLLGQDVLDDFIGVKFYYFSDGSVIRNYKITN